MPSAACKRCGADGESGSASCDYCGAIDRSTTIPEEALLVELAISADRRLLEHEDRYHARAKLPPTSDLIRCLSLQDSPGRSAAEREAPSQKPKTSPPPGASVVS